MNKLHYEYLNRYIDRLENGWKIYRDGYMTNDDLLNFANDMNDSVQEDGMAMGISTYYIEVVQHVAECMIEFIQRHSLLNHQMLMRACFEFARNELDGALCE